DVVGEPGAQGSALTRVREDPQRLVPVLLHGRGERAGVLVAHTEEVVGRHTVTMRPASCSTRGGGTGLPGCARPRGPSRRRPVGGGPVLGAGGAGVGTSRVDLLGRGDPGAGYLFGGGGLHPGPVDARAGDGVR